MTGAGERRICLDDLPAIAPVFPLNRTIMLPGRELPLNIFEPRYLAMVDASLGSDRVIGIVQPVRGAEGRSPELEAIGGLGRITAFSERPDGRYIICLTGLCRFRIANEPETGTAFRQCRLDYAGFADDLTGSSDKNQVNRSRLLAVFASYLSFNEMETDWDEIANSDNETLVNTLAMIGPFGSAEKQTLLEAADLATRADFLIAFTELTLAEKSSGSGISTRTH